MNDTTHTILSSAKRFFSGTALSRVAGMLRDMSMAYVFGTQASIASFMIAFRFSNLLRRLFGEGALQSAFIPEFEAIRHENSEKAFRFFRDLAVLLTLFLSTIIVIGCTSLGLLLMYGDFNEDTRDVIFLTLLMLPSLLFICLYGFNSSLLQCEKNYFTSSVAPVAFNIIWIIALFFLRHTEHKEAMPWLAIGVIVACLCQWLMTVPKTLAILKNKMSIPVWKEIKILSVDILRIFKPLSLGIMGVAASQVNNAVDALFARFAEAEGPAFLWYAIRLQQLPLALFGIAISGAILPPLSRAIKASDWEKYHHFINYALQKSLFLMLPITCFLLVGGDTCINLIYGRGDFNSESIGGTTLCLWAYGLGLLPSALVLIFAPACYAQSNYRLPTYASFLTMVLNAILNAWMIFGLGLGAMSVALATSISNWVNLIFLYKVLPRKVNNASDKILVKSFIEIGLASAIASLGVILLRQWTHDNPFLLLLQKEPVVFTSSLKAQLGSLIWQAGLFSVLFFSSVWGLKFLLSNPKAKHIKTF